MGLSNGHATDEPVPKEGTDHNFDETISLQEMMRLSHNPSLIAARYHADGSEKLQQDYKLRNKVLGTGSSAQVVLARGRTDGREYAVKRFFKSGVCQEALRCLKSEVQVCLCVDHPNIVRVYDIYESNKSVDMVMEYCKGGELFQHLESKGRFDEPFAARVGLQMLRAINHLHANSIVHRDLKLENFLYSGPSSSSTIKLIDFGLALFWDPSRPMTSRCGTLAYVSPDILGNMGYTSKCDIWSLGVIIFMLLVGYPPFTGPSKTLQDRIIAGAVDWDTCSMWESVSQDARDFVERLLTLDPDDRPSAQRALQHRWLKLAQDKQDIRSPALLTLDIQHLQSSLSQFLQSSRIRRAALQVLALGIDLQQVRDLSNTFLSVDQRNTGTISFSELKDAIRAVQKHTGTNANTPDSNKLNEIVTFLDTYMHERVTFNDFLAATLQIQTTFFEEDVRRAFNRLDKDHSGTISQADLRSALGDFVECLSNDTLLQESGVQLDHQGELPYDGFRKMLVESDPLGGPPAARNSSRGGPKSTCPRSSSKQKVKLTTGEASERHQKRIQSGYFQAMLTREMMMTH